MHLNIICKLEQECTVHTSWDSVLRLERAATAFPFLVGFFCKHISATLFSWNVFFAFLEKIAPTDVKIGWKEEKY